MSEVQTYNGKPVVCNYCEEKVPDRTDQWPTWFGRYHGSILDLAICKDCLPKNRENWEKGVVPKLPK